MESLALVDLGIRRLRRCASRPLITVSDHIGARINHKRSRRQRPTEEIASRKTKTLVLGAASYQTGTRKFPFPRTCWPSQRQISAIGAVRMGQSSQEHFLQRGRPITRKTAILIGMRKRDKSDMRCETQSISLIRSYLSMQTPQRLKFHEIVCWLSAVIQMAGIAPAEGQRLSWRTLSPTENPMCADAGNPLQSILHACPKRTIPSGPSAIAKIGEVCGCGNQPPYHCPWCCRDLSPERLASWDWDKWRRKPQ
jgi:hypothetical protein